MVMFCKLPQRTALAISLEANGSELQTIFAATSRHRPARVGELFSRVPFRALWVLEFQRVAVAQGTRMAPIERSTFKLKMAYS